MDGGDSAAFLSIFYARTESCSWSFIYTRPTATNANRWAAMVNNIGGSSNFMNKLESRGNEPLTVARVRWWLAASLLIVAPLPFLGAVTLLRVSIRPLWLMRGLNESGIVLPPLAGALGIMVLASILMKYPKIRGLAILSGLLALGCLIGLGGVFLNKSLSLVWLGLIPATLMIGLGLSISGLLNRLGTLLTLTVVVLCSLLFVISLFSILSILVMYLWPLLGIGLLFRRICPMEQH